MRYRDPSTKSFRIRPRPGAPGDFTPHVSAVDIGAGTVVVTCSGKLHGPIHLHFKERD